MSAEDQTDALLKLLPTAHPIDPWRNANTIALCTALAGAADSVDTAITQHLADFLPASCGVNGTYLDDWADLLGLPEDYESDAWAGYTDTEKQAAIESKLRGRGDPSIANLQALYEVLFAYPNLQPSHLVLQRAAAGALLTGDYWQGSVGEAYQGVWILRYMANVLNASPNDFGSWDTVGTVLSAADASPPDALRSEVNGDLVTGVSFSGDWAIRTDLNSVSNNDEVRLAVWARHNDATANTFKLQLLELDGTTVAAEFVTVVKPNVWQKYTVQGNVGAGNDFAAMRVVWGGGSQISLGWAVAGIRAPALEQRAQDLAPLHTTGLFWVDNEDGNVP